VFTPNGAQGRAAGPAHRRYRATLNDFTAVRDLAISAL
jgi:hypothetical protein